MLVYLLFKNNFSVKRIHVFILFDFRQMKNLTWNIDSLKSNSLSCFFVFFFASPISVLVQSASSGDRVVFFYFFACLLGPDSLRSTTSVKWVTFSKKQTRRSFSRFPSFLFYTHMITIISTSWTGVTDIHPGASWEGTGGIFRHTKIARCIYTKESPFLPPLSSCI